MRNIISKNTAHQPSFLLKQLYFLAGHDLFSKFIVQSYHMRVLLAILVSLTFFSANAQTHLPIAPTMGFTPWSPFNSFYQPIPINTSKPGWQLNPFASVSAGYIFYNRGSSYVAAPMGLILSHPINKNLTGFGGVTATPYAFSSMLYPGSFTAQGYPVNDPYGRPNLGISTGITGGLMYTNDAKTFSISGRVSVDRTTYPNYYVPAPRNIAK